jgi:signal transduction histidine kinase/ActR/RegA family two-component response regulator
MLRSSGYPAAYAIAIVATAASTAIRAALDPILGQSIPYTLYFPAVAFVAFTGRLGASLITTVASAIVANLLFVGPRFRFSVGTTAEAVDVAAFLIAGALIAVLTDRLYQHRQQLLAAAQTAAERNATLEEERAKLERESTRLALLAEVATIGVANPSFREVANHAAERVAERLGDACVIRLQQDGQLVAVAWKHRDPAARRFLETSLLRPEEIGRNVYYTQLLEQRRTVRLQNLHPSDRRPADVELATMHDRFAARQGLATPIQSGDTLVGLMTVFRAENIPYTDTETLAFEAVASRVALALENAKLVADAQREADEARRARADAEEAGRVKDDFLATLSHELRTPLNAIVGWAHMLRDPEVPDDRRRAAVETILRNAQSQEQLISDILEVQRIMAGKLRLELRSADMSNIVRAAAETVQPSADVKDIKLQLLLDLNVTPIWGDPDRLQQVVWNLLSNAIKFTPHGGRVQVRVQQTENECEMVVEDNGPGISPEFIPYVFDRFRQADSSSTRHHRGLGLGLAIVRNLIEMHGGSISASNVTEPGRTGAVFTIKLPRRVASRLPAAAGDDLEGLEADARPSWLGEGPSLRDVRVLVVDDDPDARELIGTILERYGADVAVAGSVEEGMAALTKRAPHVIVTDIEMPHEDGYSFIRRIRSLPAESGGKLPAAALTAYVSASDRMKVLAAGFNMHVAKPVQPAELAMIVASLAGRGAASLTP